MEAKHLQNFLNNPRTPHIFIFDFIDGLLKLVYSKFIDSLQYVYLYSYKHVKTERGIILVAIV